MGDHVLLKINKTKKGLSPKLAAKYQGPYYIVDVNPNHTFQIRHCSTNNVRRGRIHASQLKPYRERDDPQNPNQNHVIVPQDASNADINASNSASQLHNSTDPPLVIEKIHRATRPQQGIRWYYVKVAGIRGTRLLHENSIPRHMKEAFHLNKTVAGKTRKRKHKK